MPPLPDSFLWNPTHSTGEVSWLSSSQERNAAGEVKNVGFKRMAYRSFSAWARSSGVICCQITSRFCCAHWLLGSAARAELSQ